ncbi:MAG: Maf family nucleotide pyrophosphatase [Pricia sp.]
MLYDKLRNHNLILASASPRRQRFFREMGLDFEIRLKPVKEVYPDELKGSAISDYLAELKASAFDGTLTSNEILITSDTVVWHKERSLAKAADVEEAFAMLRTLSGEEHEVITSVCFTFAADQDTVRRKTVRQITKVRFKELTDEEIRFYIDNYAPFDKAGAYGIQEWIGLIGIESIEGSYPNVVGLPSQVVYKTLMDMVG